MDSNHIGCYAEQLFFAECTKRGYTVSVPVLSSSIYDCIVDNGTGLYKIQIKSTFKNPIGGRKSVHLTIKHNRAYPPEEIDYFAFYSYYHEGFFIVKNLQDIRSIRLNKEGKHADKFCNFVFN